ncbi:MAG: signal peptidase II [Rhodospirillales bacterium]|nr:signal peptidase II [Rhodospirillales bacterium]
MSHRQLALVLAALVILLDQASKWLIVAVVMQPPRIIEVTGFFNLVLTYNRGVSFGLGAGVSVWILVGLSLVIVAGLLVWLSRQDRALVAYAIGLVVGGALGNVIDRLHAPGVIDFLDFHAFGWQPHWPAFNLADSAIAVGVALLIFDGLFLERSEGRTEGLGGNGGTE